MLQPKLVQPGPCVEGGIHAYPYMSIVQSAQEAFCRRTSPNTQRHTHRCQYLTLLTVVSTSRNRARSHARIWGPYLRLFVDLLYGIRSIYSIIYHGTLWLGGASEACAYLYSYMYSLHTHALGAHTIHTIASGHAPSCSSEHADKNGRLLLLERPFRSLLITRQTR